jgi:membrane fusion protein, multidrug efflux system
MNSPAQSSKEGRNRALIILAVVILIAAIGYGVWWFVHGRYHETTDDAYVAGNVIQITSQVAGTVVSVVVDDTDFVKAGAPLVRLDQADARVALDQAEADLARSVRDVRSLFADDAALAAEIPQREAEVARSKDDLARRQGLASTGAVSGEEIVHASTALKAAEAALTVARERFNATRVLTAGTSIEHHPTVAKAAARFKEAFLAQSRSVIVAPVSGYVAKRSVQAGQRVAPGAPLMALVPLDSVWAEVNFKEVQLQHMRVGQPVKITADIYGNDVEYHGQVAGLGAGTGSAFALLPAQNATGNWIKVVQRLPVRVALDPKELAEHPLRIGLSLIGDVDTANRDGKPVTDTRDQPSVVTSVYDDRIKAAEIRAREIIAASMVGAAADAGSNGR